MGSWFKARYKWREVLRLLNPNEIGNVTLAVFEEIQPETLSEKETMVYTMIRSDLLEDKEHDIEVSAKRAMAGSLGGTQKARNAADASQHDGLANASKPSKSSKCYEGENAHNTHSINNIYINNKKSECIEGVQGESEKPASKQKRFTPPTIEEVKAYISEKGYTFSAERFIDYYSSNGWKVGKNPMKDWKAACRTWAGNSYDTPAARPRQTTKTTTEQAYDQRPNTEPDGDSVPEWLKRIREAEGA